MSGVAAPLSTTQMALLPTHDPLVGRAVGSMLNTAVMFHKVPIVKIDGTLNGDKLALSYTMDKMGVVTADGYAGSVKIHEVYNPVSQAQPTGSQVFGVAGPGTGGTAGKGLGALNDVTENVTIATQRSTAYTQLTDELRQASRGTGGWKEKIQLSPSLGGPYVDINTAPHLPTETEPIVTTDDTWISGQSGDLKWAQQLTWSTTTWAVINSDREGWSNEDMRMFESGTGSESYARADEKLEGPIAFSVSPNHVEGTGGLKLSSAAHADQVLNVSRSYDQRTDALQVDVSEKLGDQTAQFSIVGPKLQ